MAQTNTPLGGVGMSRRKNPGANPAPVTSGQIFGLLLAMTKP